MGGPVAHRQHKTTILERQRGTLNGQEKEVQERQNVEGENQQEEPGGKKKAPKAGVARKKKPSKKAAKKGSMKSAPNRTKRMPPTKSRPAQKKAPSPPPAEHEMDNTMAAPPIPQPQETREEPFIGGPERW